MKLIGVRCTACEAWWAEPPTMTWCACARCLSRELVYDVRDVPWLRFTLAHLCGWFAGRLLRLVAALVHPLAMLGRRLYAEGFDERYYDLAPTPAELDAPRDDDEPLWCPVCRRTVE